MPPPPIVTLVEGTPESCRATARELGELSDGTHDLATGLFRVRGESEGCWTGPAGDAFRESMTPRGKGGNDTAEASSRAKVALEKFADALQTVVARMDQARSVAADYGLTVTPTTIEQPPETPPPGDLWPAIDGEAFQREAAALEAWEHQRRGFEEAKEIVEQARRIEADAHAALNAALKYEVDAIASILAGGIWNVEALIRGAVTSPQSYADDFAKKSAELFESAAKHNRMIDAPGLTPAQQANRAALRDRLLAKSQAKHAAATRLQQAADRLYSKTPLNAGVTRTLGKTIFGRIPIVGSGITIGLQADAVINEGKPPVKAGLNVVGGIAGGIITGAASGAVVGGPYGAIVGVGVGIVGSGLGAWTGDLAYDWVTER